MNPSYEKYEPPPQTSAPKLQNEKSNQSDEDVQPSTSHSSRSHKKKHKKDRKSEQKSVHKSKKDKQKVVAVMEFDGTEDYYVDKTAERGYLRVQTLHKPACPR